MRNIVIGTAGHIDHGKTALVKALTGKDTDSLPEEKKRGMTIDIGFAFLSLKNGRTLGVVDVPGHERFIKNMVAGVIGIDMIMLVIACDDGIKPQTIEHLHILQMLGVKNGVVILTKRDLVDDERVKVLKEEIKEFLKGSFLENSDILEFSIKAPETTQKIQNYLEEATEKLSINKRENYPFKMDIDRVFSVTGFGTVVTGTIKNSSVKVGDNLILYPQMREVRVKNLETNGERREILTAGNRCAINILGAEVKEIQRGDVIGEKEALTLSNRIDCLLTLLKKDKEIKNNHRVRLNIGTREIIGRIKIFGKDIATSNEESFIQLELEKIIPITNGDCGVIRDFSPVETIGGIKIINGTGEKVKRKDSTYIEKLQKLSSLIKNERIETFIKDNPFLDLKEISLKLGEMITFQEMEDISSIEEIGGRFIHIENLEFLEKNIVEFLKEYHKENHLSSGIKLSQLKNRYFENLSLMLYNKLLERAVEKEILKIEKDRVALKEFQIKLTGEEKKIKDKIFKIYKNMGFSPQPSRKILQDFSNVELLKKVHHYMVDEGFLVKIGEDRYILKGYFKEAENLIREKLIKDKKLTLRDGASLFKSNRETALMILEKLDSIGVTKRVDNYRVLTKLQEEKL